ncbi:MAG TPA: AzlD domain-containing protein [Propionibacteriaceae bacterium]|nr:AzlD domain-containing protein [Propionibacteriaceae bacterium]
MSTWGWVVVAGLVAVATKLLGYLLPARWLESPRVARVSNAVTIGLLSSLVLMNTLASGPRLRLDARVVALVAGVVALKLRAPFVVVVLVGAVSAALVRLAGWG